MCTLFDEIAKENERKGRIEGRKEGKAEEKAEEYFYKFQKQKI